MPCASPMLYIPWVYILNDDKKNTTYAVRREKTTIFQTACGGHGLIVRCVPMQVESLYFFFFLKKMDLAQKTQRSPTVSTTVQLY